MSFILGEPKALFSLHSTCAAVGALSLNARCADDAFFLFGKCVGTISRAKNEDSRPFSKVDEVELYPYYVGEVVFFFLTYR